MTFDWHTAGTLGIYSIATLLCLLGFVLSCLSISGTWLVWLASALLCWTRWPSFPGLITLVIFLLLCIAVEVVETLAAGWGVQRRGGSKAAGWAALGGGLLGLVLGGLLPIPLIGPLVGMTIASFGCAFAVEHRRMKQTAHAAHVATGAVLARLMVIFVKIGATALMTFILGIGILMS